MGNKEHTKNARSSTKEVHEKGRSRNKADGKKTEKGDARREHRPHKWKGKWPKDSKFIIWDDDSLNGMIISWHAGWWDMAKSRHYDDALYCASADEPNFRAAVEHLKAAIDENDPRAAYALATWYLHGIDGVVEVNYEEAVKLLKKSAMHRFPPAIYDLGVCYYHGSGVKKSLEHAFECYAEASTYGDTDAIISMTDMLEHDQDYLSLEIVARTWRKVSRKKLKLESLLNSDNRPIPL